MADPHYNNLSRSNRTFSLGNVVEQTSVLGPNILRNLRCGHLLILDVRFQLRQKPKELQLKPEKLMNRLFKQFAK